MSNLENKPSIGISSCLLGAKVRFDGGHKRDRFITDQMSEFFEFLPCCPEVAIGLTIPRPTLRLVGKPEDPQLVFSDDESENITSKMQRFAKSHLPKTKQLSGYIFKSKSPSCGMQKVKLYHPTGGATNQAVGIYAKTIMDANPLLPVEDEGRLNDARLRENFIERVLLYYDWQNLSTQGINKKSLVAFHSRYKLALMAHHLPSYRTIGRLIADLKSAPITTIAKAYIEQMMAAFKYLTTRKKNANVLQHCQGYFKKNIDKQDKEELSTVIEQYRTGLVPLIVPATLINHHLRKSEYSYLVQQSFLSPYPAELMLRNAI